MAKRSNRKKNVETKKIDKKGVKSSVRAFKTYEYGDLITLENNLSMMTVNALLEKSDLSVRIIKKIHKKGILILDTQQMKTADFDNPDFIKANTLSMDPKMPVEPEEKVHIYIPDMLDQDELKSIENQNEQFQSTHLDPIFSKKGLLFYNKPANLVMSQICPQNKNRPFRFINRLDTDTTGLFSATQSGLVHSMTPPQKMKKTYLAIVHGTPSIDQGIISCEIFKDGDSPKRGVRNFIVKDFSNLMVQMAMLASPQKIDLPEIDNASFLFKAVNKDFQKAESTNKSLLCGTLYKTIATWDDEQTKSKMSLLELQLITGRTHQIRASLEAMGTPVVGDTLYNHSPDKPENIQRPLNRQALHSWKCKFFLPLIMGKKKIKADIPQDMASLIPKTVLNRL